MVFAAIAFSFPFCHAFPPRACASTRRAAPLCAIELKQLQWPCLLDLAGDKRESSNARSLRSSQSSLIGDVEIASTFLANTIPHGRLKLFITKSLELLTSNCDFSFKEQNLQVQSTSQINFSSGKQLWWFSLSEI